MNNNAGRVDKNVEMCDSCQRSLLYCLCFEDDEWDDEDDIELDDDNDSFEEVVEQRREQRRGRWIE